MVVLRSSDAGSCIVPMPGRSQEPKMYGYPMVIPAEISPTATRMISHLGGGSCGPRLISLSYLRTPYATTDATSDPAASALPYALIHRSAWNGHSAKFAYTEFSEVRAAPTRLGARSLRGATPYPAIQLLEDGLSSLVSLLVIAYLP